MSSVSGIVIGICAFLSLIVAVIDYLEIKIRNRGIELVKGLASFPRATMAVDNSTAFKMIGFFRKYVLSVLKFCIYAGVAYGLSLFTNEITSGELLAGTIIAIHITILLAIYLIDIVLPERSFVKLPVLSKLDLKKVYVMKKVVSLVSFVIYMFFVFYLFPEIIGSIPTST